MENWRGLMITPGVKYGQNFVSLGGGVDLQDLRTYLLFWDKLDYPSNNRVFQSLDPHMEFLSKTGILQRTHVKLPGGAMDEIGNDLIVANSKAFLELDSANPGLWSIATGEGNIPLPDEMLRAGRGALVKLHYAIPVPDRDVPLADILEFRIKRNSELLSLRHHLERTYQAIAGAPDQPLAWRTEIENLERSVADQIRATQDARFAFRFANLTANINLLALGTAVSLYASGLPLLQSILSGIAPALSIEGGASLERKSISQNPYRYVASYHHELRAGSR